MTQEGFIKLTKKTLVMGLIFSILLPTFILYSLFKFPKSASAAWFDDSWTYRQRVDITNGGSAQTDYQVSITLDTATLITAGKVQSDCDDLRITDTNGKLLPHWIEESNPGCNSATTKIWTKAPSITTSGATVYLYYGNPSATNVENPTQVFVFYDNFSGDLSRWTNPSGCAGAISSGVLQISASTGCDSTPMYVTNLTQSDASGYAFDFRGKFSSGGSGRLQMYQRYRSTNGHMARLWITGTVTYYQEGTPGFGGNTDIGSTGTSADTWYNFGIKVTGTSNQLYVNGTSIGTGTTVGATLTTQTDLTVGLGDYNTTVQYDNVRVRKSASTEPTIASPTNEEKGTAPVTYWKFDEGQGQTINDSFGNNSAFLGATSGSASDDPAWKAESDCISGACLYYDGTDDLVRSDTTNQLNFSTTHSFSAWFKYTGFATGNNGGKGGLWRTLSGPRVYVADNSNNTPCFQGSASVCSTALSENKWYFFTHTYDGTTIKIYIDGREVASGSPGTVTDGTNISIGYSQWFHKGFIDEVKLYNYVLTAAQIKANFNAKATGDGASAVLGSPSTGSGQLASGLVGYWKMDESSGDTADSSGNSQTLTNTNTATFATGKYGNAGSLASASSQYFTCTDANCGGTTELDVPTTFTASAWVNKPDVTQNYAMIIAKSAGAGSTNDAYELRFNSTTGKIQFVGYIGGAYQSIASNTALTNSTWQHVAVTYDGANLRLFLNGASDAAAVAVTGAMSNSTADFAIGRRADGYYYNGSIDEARVYNRALSPDEVSQLYNFAPGPVGYWNLNEGSGTAASDISGNANTGTWQGTTTNVWAPGKYGKGGNFNGSDNYVSLTDGANMSPGAGNFTVSAWVKTDVVNGADHWIWVNYGSATNNLVLLRLQSTNSFQAVFRDAEADTGLANTTTTLAINTWYYVTAVRDGTIVYIYLNGIPEASSTTAALGTITSSDGTAPVVGRNELTPGTYFDGNIDEVKIYNYARNSKQIVEDMNAGHPAPGSPVGSAVGHWKFDEGADNTCASGDDVCNSGSQGSTLDGAQSGMSVPATATSGWIQSGKFGKAMFFDATDDRVDIGDNLNPGTGDFAASAWVYKTETSDQYIVSKMNGPSTLGWYFRLNHGGSDTRLYFVAVVSGTTLAAYSSGQVSLNTWTHVAFTFRRSDNTVTLYLNGVPQTTTYTFQNLTTTADISTSNSFWIGGHSGGLYGRGGLDEVKYYNYTLTAAEVKLDMNQGQAQVLGALSDNSTYQKSAANQEYCVPGDSTSCVTPIASYDFDEGTGTAVNDRSGNANTGTWAGTNTNRWSTGKFGKAGNYSQTASDDLVSIPTNSSYLNKAFSAITAEAWVYPTSFVSGSFGPTVISNTDGNGWAMRVNNGYLLVDFRLSGGTVTSSYSTIQLTLNSWNHIALTYSSSTGLITGYLNGASLGTKAGSGTMNQTASCTFIGNEPGGCANTGGEFVFIGKIDQVRVFDYARTGAQIAWDYNRGGPVGHWRLDECQGTTANDSSGNSNSGTITIGATGTYTSAGTCASGTSTHAWAGGVAGAGKRNYALSFDGTDDKVTTTLQVSPAQYTTLTMSAWVKPAANATSYDAILAGDDGSYDRGFGINTATYEVQVGNGSWQPGPTISAGRWDHVVVVYDTSQISFYHNGVRYNYGSGGVFGTSTQALEIGEDTACGTCYFNGVIDDARVYSYALTATQVKTLMNEGAVNFAPVTGAP